MSNVDQEKLKAMAAELAKDIKTQGDLSDLSASLLKMTVEAALGAEMEEHLGYAKHQVSETDNERKRTPMFLSINYRLAKTFPFVDN
jgi:transposase-like protein